MKSILNIKLGVLIAFVTFISMKCIAQNEKKYSVKIQIKYNNAKSGDTLLLESFDTMNYSKPKKDTASMNSDGLFIFNLTSIQNCGYWQLTLIDRSTSYSKSGNYIFRSLSIPFFWEQDDNIKLELTNIPQSLGANSTYSFSGIGSNKYNLRAKLFSVKLNEVDARQSALEMKNWKVFDSLYNYIQLRNRVKEVQIPILEKNKEKISALSYNVLKADINFQYGAFENYQIKKYFISQIEQLSDDKKALFFQKFEKSSSQTWQSDISYKDIYESCYAIPYLVNKVVADNYVLNGREDPLGVYNAIKNRTAGKLRDALFLYFLLSKKNYASSDSIFHNAKNILTTKVAREKYKDIEYLFNHNLNFKSYGLTDENGKTVNLKDLKGKVLFLDFWFTGCNACAQYYKTVLSKVEPEFKNNNGIVFVSISSDRNKEYWNKGLKTGLYTSENALNLFTSGKGFEHSILHDNNIVRFPTVILLDKVGKVRSFNSEDLYTINGLLKALKEADKN